MKKALLALCLVAFLASCSKNNPWEYKVVKVAGKPAEELADYGRLWRTCLWRSDCHAQ